MQSADRNENAATESPAIPGGEHLPGLAAEMLRGVADHSGLGSHREDGPGEAMRAVCQNARSCGLRVEQLLVVLKDSWRRLPEAKRLDRYESDELLARVIRDCIEAFYADPPQEEGPLGREGR